MGIAIIVDADADPTLPPLLPSAGVGGYSGRWIASALPGADGSTVANLPAVIGGTARDLKQATTAAQPTLKVSGAEKWLQFDGVDDFLIQSAAVPAWLTTVMVVRYDAASGLGALWQGSAGNFVAIGSLLNVNANMGSGGGGAQVSSPAIARNKWIVVAAVQNGANSIVYADGGRTTGTLGTNAATLMSLAKTSGVGQISVAEVLTYDGPVSSAQLDSIAAAMKASHPLLFP